MDVWSIAVPFLAFAAAVPAGADEQVRRLADASHERREAADARLRRAGAAALPALLRGLGSPDPEVRRRCERLCVLACSPRFESQLEALLEDPEAPEAQNLPGWRAFRRRFGTGMEARQCYAGMLAAEPDLLRSVEPSQHCGLSLLIDLLSAPSLASAMKQKATWADAHFAGRVRAVLFLAVEAGEEVGEDSGEDVAGLLSALGTSGEAAASCPIVRALAVEFLERRLGTNDLETTIIAARRLGLQQFIDRTVVPHVVRRLNVLPAARRRGICVRTADAAIDHPPTKREVAKLWLLGYELNLGDEMDVALGRQFDRLSREADATAASAPRGQ